MKLQISAKCRSKLWSSLFVENKLTTIGDFWHWQTNSTGIVAARWHFNDVSENTATTEWRIAILRWLTGTHAVEVDELLADKCGQWRRTPAVQAPTRTLILSGYPLAAIAASAVYFIGPSCMQPPSCTRCLWWTLWVHCVAVKYNSLIVLMAWVSGLTVWHGGMRRHHHAVKSAAAVTNAMPPGQLNWN